jgi:outer membrane protein OmpA-like peptidoglycan-associated protein
MAREEHASKPSASRAQTPTGGTTAVGTLQWQTGTASSSPASVLASGAPSVEGQAAWLSRGTLHGAQRRALVTRIGRTQGNGHLGRVLASVDRPQRSDVPRVQRQGGEPPAPAPPPTFVLSPSAMTVGMGERVRLNAHIQGVTNRAELGGTAFVTSTGVHTIPRIPSVQGLLRRRHLTLYAANSGQLSGSFDYQGQSVSSNTVTITVRDPTFQISPDSVLVDKGAKQRFVTRVTGIYSPDDLGGTASIATTGIELPILNIRDLQPNGSFKASAADAGVFHMSFDYFGRNFDSNEVNVAIIEPSVAISTPWPHYYVGDTFDINVLTQGIGDPERLGGTAVISSAGLELIGPPPSATQFVPNGVLQARLTQEQPAWVELSFDYMDGQVRSERLEVTPLPPTVGLSPMEMSVGTRQRFPLRYQLRGLAQPDEFSGSAVVSTAPVTVVEHMATPTQPNESGDMILEADNQVGSGILSLSINYYGREYESPPVTINVTPGPTGGSSPERILFDTDQDVIRPDAAAALTQVAARLRAEPNLVAGLEGHADTRHTDEHNVDLSYRRAASTRSYLINVLKVNPAQVPEDRVIGWGEALPAVSPETNPAEFQANRRVEIVLSEGPGGEELAPALRLSPHTIRAGVGQRFAVGYALRNVHDTSAFGGSALIHSSSLSQVGDGLPSMPGSETGTITMQAGDQPGRAEISMSVTYDGQPVESNTVQVEIVGPSIQLSPERWEDLEIGDMFAIQYTIGNMPEPTSYEGSAVTMTQKDGGEVLLLSGQPTGLTGQRMVDGLQMHATKPGEVRLNMSIQYNGRQYTSNQVFMRVHPHRYTSFTISMYGGGEGGEVVGAGYYTFELKENGPQGRTGVLRFAGAGITGGLPGGGFGPGSSTTFRTTVPMRLEDFQGGGRVGAGGVYPIYGGGYSVLVFYCGDKPTQQVEGWGHGWGLAAGASWFHGHWQLLGTM